jgi:putative endonuclease
VSKESLNLGRLGEDAAAAFLQKNGYSIISRNHRTKFGEIDIIARDRGVYCFIEVKARSGGDFGSPEEAVDAGKQRRMAKSGLSYLQANRLLDQSARFDVVSVEFKAGRPEVKLLRNAFELDGRYTY